MPCKFQPRVAVCSVKHAFFSLVYGNSQSMILAFITRRVSHKTWVKTEALELNHYVEVREEFDRVRTLLFKNRDAPDGKKGGAGSSTTSDEDQDGNITSKKSSSDGSYDGSWNGMKSFMSGVVDHIRRPGLWHKYNSLLIQVRFHDLRKHFLISYNLPPNFKVADYLVRCELHVLIKLVHVSSVAWLLLTASFNLLYFLLGVIGYFEESPQLVGTALIYIFYFALFGFVVLALLVFHKVKYIFQEIMHRNELWESTLAEERHRELAKEQMQLFWFGSPKLVISALQFMQFGYAVALAVVLMFWETIDDADISMGWYFMAILLCYGIFVAVAAHVIPRYTLCTSLAQLVDKDRLNTTVAKFHLEEARRQREEEAYIAAYDKDHPLESYHSTLPETMSMDPHNLRSSVSSVSSLSTPTEIGGPYAPIEMDLEGVEKQSVKPTAEEERFNRRQARRRQRKSVSDGVALMASLKDVEEEKTEVEDDHFPTTAHSVSSEETEKSRRDRRKAMSDGVAAMASMRSSRPRPGLIAQDSQRIANLVDVDTASLREQLTQADLMKFDKKSQRTKSKSDPERLKRLLRKGPKDGEESTNEKRRSITFGILPSKSHDKEEDFDDNLSDVDDIPGVDYGHLDSIRKAKEHEEERLSFKSQCEQYFLSKKFPVFSNVFGTMVAFFLIGSRVERFLHTEDIVARDFISFDFNETVTFWILSCYFMFFLLIDALALYSVNPNGTHRKSRSRFLAACMDAALVALCWILFWVAESKRCCNETEESPEARWLEDEDKGSNYGPAPCSCPAFGSRLYGGLGKIEPFTSLIALRLFRFFIARKIVRKRNRKLGILPSDHDLQAELRDEANLDPFNVNESTQRHGSGDEDDHGEHHDGHDDHGHHDHQRGSAAELWETAIAQHPDIVEKYGMFSGEILQLMLGLPLPVNAGHGKTMDREETPIGEEALVTVPGPAVPSNYKIDDKYSNLSVGAQEIIMQGMLGKTVRSVSNLAALDSVQTIPEETETNNRPSNYMFQVSDETSVAPAVNLDRLLFDTPNARLVRSMRRCDRKLLPMLNKWSSVDVVMTRFEMVYFDASEFTDVPEADSIMQALKATKGGKGLRLKDVAMGRKVVGHLPISDITSLAIERYMPVENAGNDGHYTDNSPQTEYWKEGTHNYSRGSAWPRIEQDTLAVHTSHGNTLYLRFYSDLEEAESMLNRPADEPITDVNLRKNNAFQWVQTLGRFCGPDQLHQSLPHFGEDNDNELRDYLVVHQQNEHKRNLNFLANHGPNMRNQETVGAVSERANKRFSIMRLSSFHQPAPAADDAENVEGADEVDTNPNQGRSKSVSPLRRSLSPFQRANSSDDIDVVSSANKSSSRGFKKRPNPVLRRSQSLSELLKPTKEENKPTEANDSETPSSPIPMPTVVEGDGGAVLENGSASVQHDDDSPV